MPLNLDSCITGIFVPGNIGASSGQPPIVRVMPPRLPSTFDVHVNEVTLATAVVSVFGDVAAAVMEVAAAVDVVATSQIFDEGVHEIAPATDAPSIFEPAVHDASVDEIATATDTQDVSAPTPLGISGTPVTTGAEYEHGVGSSYVGFTATASGGTAPYTYSVFAGTLPSGITLNSSTGAVSGTPAFESAGVYSGIVIRVTDNVGATADLASFTLTITFKDPYWTHVNFQLDYDAADGNLTFTDQKFGTAITVGSNPQHDTGVTPLYGTSSILYSGAANALLHATDAKWLLGASNFTVDFTARPTSVAPTTQFWIGVWGTSVLSWMLYQSGSRVAFNISTNGSTNTLVCQSAAATVTALAWARWRIDYDGTKYRLYKNGTMIASLISTHTKFASTQNFAVGSGANGSNFPFAGNCSGIRLTVGTARTASDSGYTISNRAFPTS